MAPIISEDQVAHALTGMPYPARRWQAIAWADFNCTSDRVREALQRLPELVYSNFTSLMNALIATEQVTDSGPVR